MKYLIILSVVVCLSFMLLPACAPQPEQQAEPVGEEAPSSDDDIAAIKQVFDDFVVASNAGDLATMVELCAEDEVVMPPNASTLVGKKAIESWLRDFHDTFTFEWTLTDTDIELAGDLAIGRWESTSTQTPKAGGDAISSNLKGLWIVKRQSDGAWRYTFAIWNHGFSAPPPESPTT